MADGDIFQIAEAVVAARRLGRHVEHDPRSRDFPATVAPVADVVLEDSEDAIDLTDAVDPDLFPVFEEEAAELLPQLGAALRAWAQRPEDAAQRTAALRTLHTLKGSARLAGAMRLGERAHRMESAIEAIAVDAGERPAIEALIGRFDTMQATFDALAGEAVPQVVVDLTAVSFVDSSGLGTLVAGLKALRASGGAFKLAGPGQQARTLLRLTTLERVFPIFETVEEAVSQ